MKFRESLISPDTLIAGTPSETWISQDVLQFDNSGIDSRNSAKKRFRDSINFEAGTGAMSCVLHVQTPSQDFPGSIGTGGILPVG